jgi:hypothetical protein
MVIVVVIDGCVYVIYRNDFSQKVLEEAHHEFGEPSKCLLLTISVDNEILEHIIADPQVIAGRLDHFGCVLSLVPGTLGGV